MLVTVEGMVIEDNKVVPPILNMYTPITVSPPVNTNWERDEQYWNAPVKVPPRSIDNMRER